MAGGKKDEKEKLAPIIIKRIKKGGGGHHGGAWKVAYADFVTAMMAFFLLLWLLNVTTEEQKNAISNYFDPSHPKVSQATSGAGGLLGGLTVTLEGAMVSTVAPVAQPDVPETSTQGVDPSENFNLEEATEQQLQAELSKKEDERFKEAENKLKEEIKKTPSLAELEKNLLIDVTPEGMRIQIVDDKGRSMFPSGSAVMYPFMRELLLKVTGVITPLPNQVSIRGHTDSARYKDASKYDNWNLSADRAQASRRVMVEGKLPETRVENVMGRADREHLDTKDANAARNRRISIILLRERLTQAAIEKLKAEHAAAAKAAKDAAQKKAPEKKGIEIIDDTKPAADAAPKKDPNAVPPLPVAPSTPTSFERQPQVLDFGAGEGASKPSSDDSLYEGPAQTPAQTIGAPIEQKGPPRITKKLFNLPSDEELEEEAAAAAESAPVPVEQPAPAISVNPTRRSLDFGDPTPAPSAPIRPAPLPSAPETQIINQTPQPTNTLQFNAPAVPQAAPAQTDELQLINPRLSPKVLDFESSPSTPQTRTQQNAPTQPQSSGSPKELTF